MSRRLPPLNALRSFEAAARHLSFTRAADELHVTQAAISQQVKLLEATLGVTLFRRLNRRLVLTEAGASYLPPLQEALDRIAEATFALHRREGRGPLRVTVLPSFAANWLLPRLGRFRARHPDIDIEVTGSYELSDLARDGFDIGLRYGRGRYPGLHVELLLRDEIFPVCSPRLTEGPNGLKRPQDLKRFTLLHDVSAGGKNDPDWRYWLDRARVDGVDVTRGLGFNLATLALAAAIAGDGVALGRRSLIVDELAAGRLVRPFGPTLRPAFVYSIVTLPERTELPPIRKFREWLLAEARE